MKKVLSVILSITLVMCFSVPSIGTKKTFGEELKITNVTEQIEQQKAEGTYKEKSKATNTEEVPAIVKKYFPGETAPEKAAVKKMKSGSTTGEIMGYKYTVSDDGYIELNDVQSLAVYAFLLMGDKTLKGRLMNDITMPSDVESAAICTEEYQGVFDGNGKTLSIGDSTDGLFVDNAGTIRKLRIVYGTVGKDDATSIGAFANKNTGTIENSISEGNTVKARNDTGGFVGNNLGTVKSCTGINNGSIYSTGSGWDGRKTGGIVGNNGANGRTEKCISKGSGKISNINGSGGTGGIAGWNTGAYNGGQGVVESCIVEGSLTIETNRTDYTGGALGFNGNASAGISDTLVTGSVKISGTSANAVGGIVGKQERYVGTCFYNATGGISGASSDKIGPVIGVRETGGHGTSKYNTDKTSLNNGLGTGINNIYYLETKGQVGLAFNDEGTNGFTCAGRYFYYGENTVNYSFTGTLGPNQISVFKLNDSEITGGSFSMPKKDSVLSVDVLTVKPLADVEPFIAGVFIYNGKDQKPTSVNSSDGILEEGVDYTATVKNSEGQTVDKCVNVGRYTMTMTGIGKYKETYDLSFTINKADPTVTVPVANDLTYNGELQDLITEGSTEDGEFSYRLDGERWTDTVPQGKDAGPYTVYYKMDGDNNHNSIDETKIEVSIKQASPSYTKEPEAKTLDFTNKEMELVEKGSTNDGKILYKLGDGEYSEDIPTGKDAGDYQITYMIKGDDNHTDSEEKTVTAKIGKVAPVLKEEPKAKDLTYNGENQELVTAGTSDDGTLMYSLDNSAGAQFNEEVPTVKDAGTYEVYYMIQGDDNHVDSEILGPVKVTIKKSDVKVTAPKAAKLKYKPTPQELLVAGTTEDGTFMYSIDKGKTYSEKIPTRKQAGTYTVYWKVVGDENHNDYVEEKPIKVKIKATAATLYKLTPKGKKIKVEWYSTNGADGYDVFFAKCGTKQKLYKSVNANVTKLTIKGLKKKGCYKVKVKAWSMIDGQKEYVKSYPLVHTYMMKSTKRYTVPKKVTANVSDITLTTGQTFKVNAKVVKKNKKKKIMPTKHSPLLRYFSIDTDIATIDKNGLVKAKSKGTCIVYAYAVNGKYKPIKVTVK